MNKEFDVNLFYLFLSDAVTVFPNLVSFYIIGVIYCLKEKCCFKYSRLRCCTVVPNLLIHSPIWICTPVLLMQGSGF